MNRRRSDIVVAVLLLAGLLLLVVVMAGTFSGGAAGTGSFAGSGPRVGLIDVVGPIYDARHWVNEIDDFRRNDKVKAIVIRLDSPGGAVAASQELYAAVARARDEKPVVASMGNVAASGAYYAALGADSIVANPGTTTGSIGVIMELVMLEELMEKIGLDSEVIKSGDLKDAGNPSRPLTAEERDYFQQYIDNAYEEFVAVVAAERALEDADVRRLADGRIYTGTQAMETGLVDVVGDQYLAIRLAAQLAGIEEEPTIVRPVRSSELDWVDLLIGSLLGRVADQVNNKSSLFQYKWNAEYTR